MRLFSLVDVLLLSLVLGYFGSLPFCACTEYVQSNSLSLLEIATYDGSGGESHETQQ